MNDKQQKDLVRQQFTRTAGVFGDFAVASRVAEAELLARLVNASVNDRGLDIACGPGTLALRFARHVRWMCGLDLTPAILERARGKAAEANLDNLAFALGDAQFLPFGNGSLDLAVTSYSLHHISDPASVIREMARVVKRGGRVGVVDIRAPENPKAREINNRIERLRDPSHMRTIPRSEFEAMFASHGLRVTAAQIEEHPRSFDHWLLVAGWKRGDPEYIAARQLMESTIPDDAADFHPHLAPPDPDKREAAPDINMMNTVLYIAGEKT
jgi:ubiquinone/menaquinone biosynthesis C-methylase UbiE